MVLQRRLLGGQVEGVTLRREEILLPLCWRMKNVTRIPRSSCCIPRCCFTALRKDWTYNHAYISLLYLEGAGQDCFLISEEAIGTNPQAGHAASSANPPFSLREKENEPLFSFVID
jgi:hypothetical protein